MCWGYNRRPPEGSDQYRDSDTNGEAQYQHGHNCEGEDKRS